MSSRRPEQRWCDLLRDLMGEAQETPESLDERLGWAAGTVGAALAPTPPNLEVSQVLALLSALGVAPQDFFARLYPGGALTRGAGGAVSDDRSHELSRVRALVDQALQVSRSPGPVDLDQIQNLVEEALDSELRRLSRPGRGQQEG